MSIFESTCKDCKLTKQCVIKKVHGEQDHCGWWESSQAPTDGEVSE